MKVKSTGNVYGIFNNYRYKTAAKAKWQQTNARYIKTGRCVAYAYSVPIKKMYHPLSSTAEEEHGGEGHEAEEQT